MIRIFHPVGQGAFYSEHFSDPEKLTVVYDCGATPYSKKFLQTKINSSFAEHEIIDILFISHFHADHINAIEFLMERCTIKNVVIPYLDDEAKALIKIANYVTANYLNTQIIDDPQSYFGNATRIIRVKQVSEDGAGNVSENRHFPIDEDLNDVAISSVMPTNGGSYTDINSGTPITSRKVAYWYYIPFNYEQKTRSAAFLQEINKAGITTADIDTIEKIQKNKKAIINAYHEVAKDLNKNSMFIYSGPSHLEKYRAVLLEPEFTLRYIFLRRSTVEAGCLYTGDADMNEPLMVDSLLHSMASVKDFIGQLTIPHHGAILNHNRSLYQKLQTKFCIVSYGTSNTYGHPSDFVIGEAVGTQEIILRVTEKQDSLVVFKIEAVTS